MLSISMNNTLYILTGCFIVFLMMIILIRTLGLISFSKMSSIDFAITIASGSLMATTVLPKEPSISEGILAIGILFLLQWIFAIFKSKSSDFKSLCENAPIQLMKNGEINYTALDNVNLTKADIMAKLREANVLKLSDVRAVVLETTGDVSVLHGTSKLDEQIMDSVICD